MSVLASFLVLVSIGFLVGGMSMQSTEAYTVAAICSAVAVILMWRHLKATKQEAAFVTDSPVATMPDWEKPRLGLSSGSAQPLDQLNVVAIDDYDSLMAAEILPSLETLSVEELEAVVAREKSGLQRQGVITRAQKLIDLTRNSSLGIGIGDDAVIETSALETVLENSSRRRLLGRRKGKGLEAQSGAVTPPRPPKTVDRSDPDLSL